MGPTPNHLPADPQLSHVAQSATFDLLDEALEKDVRHSVEAGLTGGVVFEAGGGSSLDVFRHAVNAATRDIQSHPRGDLLRRFVVQGPYEYQGPFPPERATERLDDVETAKAIRFIWSFMVNQFQGRLAELLAVGPALRLVRQLKADGRIRPGALIYVGDAAMVPRNGGKGRQKAADLHVLEVVQDRPGASRAVVQALGEVKSYAVPRKRVVEQLNQHASRCRLGLVVRESGGESICLTSEPVAPVSMWIEPARWRLPRGFWFEEVEGRSFLHVEHAEPPVSADTCVQEGDGLWHMVLRWSYEALAAAAYDMTFWYMARIGELSFSGPGQNPWPEMTPAQSGRNAATQSLYYAILRARSQREHDAAAALYNMYGFGYSLGMNFVDPGGHRQMLWPEDLREILRRGVSKNGCRIAD